MKPRRRRASLELVRLASLALLASMELAPPSLAAPQSPQGDRLEGGEGPRAVDSSSPLRDRLSSLATLPLEGAWRVLRGVHTELASSPSGAAAPLDELAEALPELEGRGKLLAATLLFWSRSPVHQKAGQVAIQQIARSKDDRAARLVAIRLLKRPARLVEASLTLKLILEDAKDPEVLTQASLSLWALDNHPSVRAPLLELLRGPDPEARIDAALGLAEMGHFADPVPDVLREARLEPTERGRLAERLYRDVVNGASVPTPLRPPREILEGPRSLSATREGSAPSLYGWERLLGEVGGIIQRHFLYRDRLRPRDLYVAALRGMVSALDEYSYFQDPEALELTEASRLGTYWGIGADLVKPGLEAPLAVEKAHAGGPALLAGLKAGDRILEVNGIPTTGRSHAELERITAGGPEDALHLVVESWASPSARSITVARGAVEVPTLESAQLQDGVGYLRLLRVGPRTAAELERAYDVLIEAGSTSIVLDLRGNPGGNLKQAVRIVDLFVGTRPEPIITEVASGSETRWFANPDEKPLRPMVILVNRGTASAAEVIAGALQDFGVATVMGQPTYGKGSKVAGFPLTGEAARLLGGESRLLLTTALLRLPRGRSLEAERTEDGHRRGGGIIPDIPLPGGADGGLEAISTEILRVRHAPQVDAFVRERYTQLEAAFKEGRLADALRGEAFEALAASLPTELGSAAIRSGIRGLLARHFEEALNRPSPPDLAEDATLGAGFEEARRRAPGQAPGAPSARR